MCEAKQAPPCLGGTFRGKEERLFCLFVASWKALLGLALLMRLTWSCLCARRMPCNAGPVKKNVRIVAAGLERPVKLWLEHTCMLDIFNRDVE